MSEEYWTGREDDFDVETESTTYILAGGEAYDVNAGEPFGLAVKRIAEVAGYGKFRVFMNGAEVKPSSAPSVIAEGDKIEVRPYDQAG
jgi:hypothetical protein